MNTEKLSLLKKAISVFLDFGEETKLIVLDVETNGLDAWKSVLSCAAIKYLIQPNSFTMQEIDRFYRFYYPIEEYSAEALAIHHLSGQIITEKRGNVHYAGHFREDSDFDAFCMDTRHFVAHNSEFEKKFVPQMKNKNHFCTMKSNAGIIQLYFIPSRNSYKFPTLRETAQYYQIPFEYEKFHDSLYDTETTGKIFQTMLTLCSITNGKK